ncbi:hypothetical protein GQX74_007776 [Glossina fuscipes]|nr:hypothetical protein GQX74_007776 [Glossina fuscipes]
MRLYELGIYKNGRAMVWMSVSSLWVGMTVVNSWHKYRGTCTVRDSNLEVFAFCMRSFQVLHLELVLRVIEVELYLRIRLTATIALRLYAEDLLIFIRFTVADYD